MARPATRYAKSGDVHIAFQVFGEGAIPLVFVPGYISNLDLQWDEPGFARLFTRLGGFARVAMFDKRGTGQSDPVPVDQLPSLDVRMDDLRAVMDAAGFASAVLFGGSEGGPLSMLFAATFPARVRALVLYGSYACHRDSVVSPGPGKTFVDVIEAGWGSGVSLRYFAPGRLGDPAFREFWARFERMGASPAAAKALAQMNAQIDVRHVLPAIRTPTLILHRAHDVRILPAAGRFLAERIAGARHVSLPGSDHPIWAGDVEAVVDEIEAFLTGARPAPAAEADTVLATVLALEAAPAGPAGRDTATAEALRDAVAHHRGRIAREAPPRWIALFDGPARAVKAGADAVAAVRLHGGALRAGAHLGEVPAPPADVAGPTVQTAQQIASAAAAGQVLASAMVRDLVAGANLHFVSRGAVALEGLHDPLPLFALETGPQPAARELSGREREVLCLVARGLSNAAIADALGLSEHTVKRHVANILDKLDLPTRAAAAAAAARAGLS